MGDGQEPSDDAVDNANVVISPPILWLGLIAIGYGLDWLVPLPFVPEALPAVWLGVSIWLAGFALAAVAVVQFRRAGADVRVETPTVRIVESGLYAWSRNPIYVGAHIGMLGVAVALDSLWVLAALLPFYLVIRYGVVAREEAYLVHKFGAPYLAYMAKVRRWL